MLERKIFDGFEQAAVSEGDGCKFGTRIERVLFDGLDGCGDLDGGDRGLSERVILDVCEPTDSCKGDGCKAGTRIERVTPDVCDGLGDVDGFDRGTNERVIPDACPPLSEDNDGGRTRCLPYGFGKACGS